jgi:hypothetical protein
VPETDIIAVQQLLVFFQSLEHVVSEADAWVFMTAPLTFPDA